MTLVLNFVTCVPWLVTQVVGHRSRRPCFPRDPAGPEVISAPLPFGRPETPHPKTPGITSTTLTMATQCKLSFAKSCAAICGSRAPTACNIARCNRRFSGAHCLTSRAALWGSQGPLLDPASCNMGFSGAHCLQSQIAS